MRYGFVVPWADAREVGDLAAIAEEHGWDGLFLWEPIWGVDAWISLGLAAVRTSKIRLGTMLTPPSVPAARDPSDAPTGRRTDAMLHVECARRGRRRSPRLTSGG